ncbi:MAG: DUF4012 domain-containing protein [Actinobacteria bacterium]|nr:DUF4012 domain-containing protein [Actinomycetota bacterium]
MARHDAPGTEQAKGKRRVWRYVVLAAVVLVALVVAAGAWIAYTGLQARNALVTAADAVAGTQDALLGADVAAAQTSVTEASALTSEAASKTSDPVWKVVGALPWIGSSPRAVTLATEAADEVVSGSLPKFVEAAAILDVETIKDAEGKVDLARLAPAGATLGQAQASLSAAAETLAEVPTAGVVAPVTEGVDELNNKVEQALGISETASQLLAVMPTMLGDQAPQTYFVAFQSPVEIRGTGGFLGTYGVLTVDGGELVQKDIESNNNLRRFPEPVVDLGPEYRALYGRDPALWQNMNMSPNFPYAGIQWATAYQLQFGQQVAGVMAVDINALEYLIQATGPVTAPNGKVLTADNVVQYLGNDIYFEFEDDNAAREQYQADVATELIERVLELEGGTGKLVKALTGSVSGGHIQLWSQDATIQSALETTPIAGATPTAEGPYAQLVLNNGAANKMDFYTERKLEYLAGQCEVDRRQSQLRATLLNNVPPIDQGPRYIYGRGDTSAPDADPLSNRTLVYLHMPIGSGVTAVRVNGEPTTAIFGAELGHPVALLDLELPAGAPVVVELDVVEPLSDAEPVVPVQPMIQPQETVVEWSGC